VARAANRACAESRCPLVLTGLAALAIAATSAGVIAVAGRPESLAMSVCAMVVAIAPKRPMTRASTRGVAIGMLGVTSPVVAVVAAGVLGLCVEAPERTSLTRRSEVLATAAFAATTFVVAVTVLCPWPAGEWLAGLWRHSGIVFGAAAGGRPMRLWHYLIADPATPAIGILVVVAIAAMWSATSWVGMAWTGLTLGVVSVRRPEEAYYLVAFMPVWCVGLLAWARRSTRARTIVAVVLAPMAASLLLTAARFVAYQREGVSLDAARRQMSSWLPRSAKAAATGGLWVLTDGQRLVSWAPGHSPPTGVEWLLVQQADTGRSSPPAVDGFRLVGENFVRHAPRLIGLPIGRTVKGYAFAIYRRKDAALPSPE
jgi:hypothetical protein